MRKHLLIILIAISAVAIGAQEAKDPLIGVWKLNLTKSKFDPGPPRRSENVTIELYGSDGIKTTADVVDAEGKSFILVSEGRFDGKEFPVKGDANADTYVMKRIDANTIERTSKKAGKVTITLRRSVSRDGKIQTVTTSGNTVEGKPLNNILIFDRQ